MSLSSFFYTQLNGSKYCYVSLMIHLNINHLFTQLDDQTDLFLTIQFSIIHSLTFSLNVSSIWPYLIGLSDVTTLGQNGPGSNGNEGVLHIPYSSSITAEMQSVYSTAAADWTEEKCWGIW